MLREKIIIASDHAGFLLKKELCAFLQKSKLSYEDLGTHDEKSCDYPDYANLLASKMDEKSFGILICGSGIGISMAANRHKNIRCALCNEPLSAKLARLHNDANVLALGGRLIGVDLAAELVRVFVNTEFEGVRHAQRIDKLRNC